MSNTDLETGLIKGRTKFAPQPLLNTVEWRELNWRKIQKAIFKLQKRIYRAYVNGDVRKGRRLQKTLIKSYFNRLLSVRKVTQDNSGKKTAGVDKVKSLTPNERLEMAKTLKLGEKSKPIRRGGHGAGGLLQPVSGPFWIPKPGRDEKRCSAVLGSHCGLGVSPSGANGVVSPDLDCIKKRPLGIPVMRDRAVQALAKSALEPEWEAKFEENSYGLRPGRSAHDAIEAIFNQIRFKSKYVLDADIAKCFDRINHQALLTKLNTFPNLRRQIKAWLKADICDFKQHERTPNHQETPQGGVISPLLSNIALHGMEERVKQIKGASLIRYADDFVILHENLDKLKQCQQIISEWLTQFDLEIKPEKTQIVHTLHELDDQKPGFDFLGFNIRQHKVGKYQSGRLPGKNQTGKSEGKLLGFKTIIKPSKENIKRHYQEIADICDELKNAKQEIVIGRLAPKIRGWCNYYKTVVSKEAFSNMDRLIYQRLSKWGYRRHPNKSKNWVNSKYWKTIGNDNWVFGVSEEKYLNKHSKVGIKRHTKVIGKKSPYDGDTIYWGKRKGKHPELKPSVAKLLKKQFGKCGVCQLTFQDEDLIETDHITPQALEGTRKDNLQLLHKHCHDIKTRNDLKAIKLYKSNKKWNKTQKQFDKENWIWIDDIPTLVEYSSVSLKGEKPCEVKVSCTVLKTSRLGDEVA